MNRGEYTSFEIKVGGIYKLVGCLTAAPMSESAETIPTTTRENNGWTTELATNQSYEISLEGLAKKDGVNLPGNMISYFVLREMKRARQIIEYRIINLDGWFVDKGKAIITEIGYTDTAGELVTFSATLRGFGKPTGQLVNPDATQVGGRNMFKKTSVIETDGALTRTETGFVIIGKTTGNSHIRIKDVIKGDGQYTLSGYVKNNFGESLLFKAADFSSPYQTYSFVGDGQPKRFEMVFNVVGSSADLNFIDIDAIANSQYIFEDIKIEKGNKATPWTPAPEDI